MVAVRALTRRLAKLERASRPRPSPFTMLYGSIDSFVDEHIIPDIEAGKLDCKDMIDVVAALRRWEEDGTWAQQPQSHRR